MSRNNILIRCFVYNDALSASSNDEVERYSYEINGEIFFKEFNRKEVYPHFKINAESYDNDLYIDFEWSTKKDIKKKSILSHGTIEDVIIEHADGIDAFNRCKQ